MEEQKPQNDSETQTSTTVSDVASTSTDNTADQPRGQVSGPEDSREGDLKIAEAEPKNSTSNLSSNKNTQWLSDLKRFTGVVHEVLSHKEDLVVKSTFLKTRPEFPEDWTRECKRLLILAVNLKRREKSALITSVKPSDLAS